MDKVSWLTAIYLPILLVSAYGWEAPCLVWAGDCGYDGGIGSCVWDGGGCGGEVCGNDCPGTANSWYCWGLLPWSCEERAVHCGEVIRPKYIIQGVPGGCRCMNEMGVPTGQYCWRTDC
jgi:hypothetical protein